MALPQQKTQQGALLGQVHHLGRIDERGDEDHGIAISFLEADILGGVHISGQQLRAIMPRSNYWWRLILCALSCLKQLQTAEGAAPQLCVLFRYGPQN